MPARAPTLLPSLLACALWLACTLSSGRAAAESERWNLHLQLGLGAPVVGALGPPGSDGRDRLLLAGFVSVDYQLARPWALEAVLGLGRQLERSEVPGRTGAELWQIALGARRRFLDDSHGYADDPEGNWLGNLWVAAHLGYAFLDEVQFGLDLEAGYELSVADPIQLGLFAKAAFLLGGRIDGADVALLAGVQGSIALHAEPPPDDSDGDGLSDERELELGTDPRLPDTDNDGLDDAVEVRTGTNARERDTDMDGIDDGREDADHDGRLDPGETDPRRADTDRGGIPDGDELRDPRLDPTDPADDDADSDGVADPADTCPASPADSQVGPTGCALAPQTIALGGVEFASGRATLRPASTAVLERAAAILREDALIRVEVAGHTDATGREAQNLALSRRRAQAVRRWLIRAGIDPRRLTVRGYGSSQPLADEATEEGRARNRRIELRRLDQ